jgi:glycosyltransferase involved in cell wall biosynthesis
VGYLTKRFPRLSETFILDEILGLEAAGVPLRIFAVADPGEARVQPDVARLASPVVYLRSPDGLRGRAGDVLSTLEAHVHLARQAPRRYLGVVAYIAAKRRHRSTLVSFAQAGRLARLLEEAGASHVHAAFAHGPASVAHFVHLLTGMPFSFAAHAKDLYVSAPDLLARKVKDATFVLACSESAANELLARAGEEGAKVLVAPHGVNTRRFTPLERPTSTSPAGPLRVLAVGRLVEKKGYPVLLDALGRLARDGVGIACRIVGAGPLRRQLEAQAARLGIDGLVELAGALTQEGIAASYREADVLVQASVVVASGDRDGIPNALLEAMSSGLAVVASAVAGIPEVVAPGCGLLVPPGDAWALARALARLANDDDLRSRLGRAARAHVAAQLDRDECIQTIVPLFGRPGPATPPVPDHRAGTALRPARCAGPIRRARSTT